MSKNDDIRLQSVQLGPLSIQRGGERGGDWVTLQPDARGTFTDGPAGSVSSRTTRRGGTLIFTLRPQDEACAQLEQLRADWDIASQAPIPAVSQNANLLLAGRLSRPARHPALMTWGSAMPLDEPLHAAGENAGGTVSYAFRVFDLIAVPS